MNEWMNELVIKVYLVLEQLHQYRLRRIRYPNLQLLTQDIANKSHSQR